MRYLPFAFLLIAAPAAAQTPTTTLAWDYLSVTPAIVATYTQTVTVDGTAITATPVCAAAGANVTCTVPIGTLASGRHTVAVAALLNGVSATTSVNGIDPTGTAPKQPSSFRYQINVTVNIP